MSELKFPLFIDLTGKKVTVFGGGMIAGRRIKTLLKFGAAVTVVAPEISEDIKKLWDAGEITCRLRAYEQGELRGEFMVLAATNDNGVNFAITREAKNKGMYANCASDKEQSNFFFPGVCTTENISVGVCGTGKCHKNVKETTEAIRDVLKRREMGD